MSDTRYISCADTAKLVRAALKKEYPGVKFSVRSKTYSGGASIDIDWTDGPTAKMVERITGQFRGATFDGMIDLKSYHTSELNGERVHFGADFIFCQRYYSTPVYTQVGQRVARRWRVELPEVKDSQYFGAHIERSSYPEGANDDLQTLIWRELQDLAVATDGRLIKVALKYRNEAA